MKKNFSIRESLAFGISTFKKRPLFFIGLTLISFFGSFVVSFAVDVFSFLFLSQTNQVAVSLIKGIAQVFIFFFSMYLHVSITRIYLLVVNGKTADFHEIFDIKKDVFIHYVLLWIIMSILIILGFIAFVLPGVFIALILQYSILCLIDDNKGFLHAMRTSRLITKGARLKLLVFFLVSLGIILLGLISFGIGIFVALPIVMLAHTYVYQSLRQQTVELHT